jgi:hypothetical protein
MLRARSHLAKVRVDRLRPKPKVGIIGEFWAMTTEGDGNYKMQAFLESEGAEVDVQLVTVWVLFMVWEAARDTLAEVWRGLHEDREGVRTGLIAAAAEGRLSAHALTARLDAARWLYRSSYHVWRIAHHLSPPDGPETPESETAEG